MATKSAGILMYRRGDAGIDVLLAQHPGGGNGLSAQSVRAVPRILGKNSEGGLFSGGRAPGSYVLDPRRRRRRAIRPLPIPHLQVT
jgi:hypothetical protein